MAGYCVYKHESPSGKVYIGITCRRPEKRWQNGRGYLYSHNDHFYHAIKKYGWNNFKHEILLTGLTKEQACKEEIRLIAMYDATNPLYGYNQDAGGNSCGRATESTRKKLSESKRGKNNPMYGKHPANEHSKGPSKIRGELHPMFGRRGPDSPNYGKKKTDETLQKLREHNHMNKSVKCVETGVVYISGQEAMRQTGIQSHSILGCCNKKKHYHSAGGYHWEFA